jgi:uncharacterized membrane protein YbhN (UPF0104 family)
VNKPLKRNWIWVLISVGISLLSIFLLYRLITPNLDVLVEVRNNLRLGPLLLTFPVFCLGLAVSSLVWGRMMNDLTDPLPISQHQIIYIVTHAARRIPGSIWHVFGRIAWYERLGIRKGVTAFTNVLETVLIILSGLVMTAIFLPFLTTNSGVSFWQILVWISLGLLAIHPRLIKAIMIRLGQDNPPKTITYRLVLGWFVHYLLIWLVGGTILFLIIQALFGTTLSLWPICVAAWCVAGVAGTLILLLPSGLGLSEATISLLLAAHIPSSIAVAAAIIMRIIMTGYDILFALLLFILRDKLAIFSGPLSDNQTKGL